MGAVRLLMHEMVIRHGEQLGFIPCRDDLLTSCQTTLPAASPTPQAKGLDAILVSGQIGHLHRPRTARGPARHRLVLQRLDELLLG